MREFKFRYWNGARMIQQKDIRLIDFNNNFVHYFDIDTQEYNQEEYCDRFHLMQYTGTKDRNGNEIYEGDIIKYTFGDEENIDYIDFGEGMFSPSNAIRWGLSNDEVIGNIYENKELLENK